LCPNTERRNTRRATFFTSFGEIVLSFANMTKSDEFTILLFMIGNRDAAFFALRDVSAVIANNPLRVAFLVYDNSDFFSLFEIFADGFVRQFGKIMVQFFGHINEEDVFLRMGKVFVIHSKKEYRDLESRMQQIDF
jgi:hypothetical protein